MEEESVAFNYFSMDFVQFFSWALVMGVILRRFICYIDSALLHLMLSCLFNAPLHLSTHFWHLFQQNVVTQVVCKLPFWHEKLL